MSLSLRTLSDKEAQEYVAHISDTAYAQEFSLFQKKYYGLESEYLGVYDGDALVVVIPVNFKRGKEAFSVHKDYVSPHILTKENIDWREIAVLMRQHYSVKSARFYFAGVTGGETPLSTFIVHLPNGMTHEDIRMRYDKKTRNEVRKSEKAGFTLRIGGSELLDNFYLLYRENMERHGTPAKAKKYFEELFSCFGKKCRIVAAYDGDILAGANLILLHNAYLRLSFNVSKTSYWDRCVNNILYDTMIVSSYDAGVRIFDFGPSLNKDASHNKFKIGYGAEQSPLVEYISESIWQKHHRWLLNKKHSLKIRVKKIWKR